MYADQYKTAALVSAIRNHELSQYREGRDQLTASLSLPLPPARGLNPNRVIHHVTPSLPAYMIDGGRV